MMSMKWIWPDSFLVYHRGEDVRTWGFSLDPRTEITYYTYDWGRGITFVVLGFGFEIVWCGL